MNKNNKGNILVTVVIVLALGLLLGTGFIAKSVAAQHKAIISIEDQQAYQAAKSVLDGILYTLNDAGITNRQTFVSSVCAGQSGIGIFTDYKGAQWQTITEMRRVTISGDTILKIKVSASNPNGGNASVAAKIVETNTMSNMIDLGGSINLDGGGNGLLGNTCVQCSNDYTANALIDPINIDQFCAGAGIDRDELMAAAGVSAMSDLPCGTYTKQAEGALKCLVNPLLS